MTSPAVQHYPMSEKFNLDGTPENNPAFDLEPDEISEAEQIPVQESLILPEEDPEHPEPTPQIDLDGMAKPVHAVQIVDGPELQFQHAHSLLESLESQDVQIHYQCREGYCGSCRTRLLEGEVHYTEEPLAWVNDDEILPCCCIPKTAIKIELD